jgi:glutamyl-tRNA synthetase
VGYFHTALLRDEHGARLAKRHDALALRTLREQGLTPAEIRARFGKYRLRKNNAAAFSD